MQKNVPMKMLTTDQDGISREIWIEFKGREIQIDYFRHYKHLEQPYHSQMSLSPPMALDFAMNVILLVKGGLIERGQDHVKITTDSRGSENTIDTVKNSTQQTSESEKDG